MNSYNVYEKLYADTKATFTIVKNDKQYSLGEYMRMKAGNKLNSSAKSTGNIVTSSFSYLKEKFAAKKASAKNGTMKKFPMRTAASALLSAVIVCSLVLSLGVFSGKNINSEAPIIVEPESSEASTETYTELYEK